MGAHLTVIRDRNVGSDNDGYHGHESTMGGRNESTETANESEGTAWATKPKVRQGLITNGRI